MLKLYRVYDGKSYIGSWRAKNEKSAVRRAKEETNLASNFFKKGQPALVFSKDMRAEEVTESDQAKWVAALPASRVEQSQ